MKLKTKFINEASLEVLYLWAAPINDTIYAISFPDINPLPQPRIIYDSINYNQFESIFDDNGEYKKEYLEYRKNKDPLIE